MKLAPPTLPHGWTEVRLADGTVQVRADHGTRGCGPALGWTCGFGVGGLTLAIAASLVSPAFLVPTLLLVAMIWIWVVAGLLGATETWRVGPSRLELWNSTAGFPRRRREWSNGKIWVAGSPSYHAGTRVTLTWDDRTHDLAEQLSLEAALGLAAYLSHHTHWQVYYSSPDIAFKRVLERTLERRDVERTHLLLGTPALFPLLAWEVTHGTDRERLLELIRRSEESGPQIAREIHHTQPPVAAAAVELLVQLRDRRALPQLRKFLVGPDGPRRAAAADALGRLQDLESVPILCEMLRERSLRPTFLVRALGRIGDPAALPPLLDLLAQPRREDAEPHREAVIALGSLGHPDALPELLRYLRDEDAGVREVAAVALGQIGDPEAVPSLCRALSDPAPPVVAAAAGALGEIGDAAAIPALSQALPTLEAGARQVVAEALGKIGADEAAAPLCKCLDDPDSGVRQAAAAGLIQLLKRPEPPPMEIRAAVPILKRLCSRFATDLSDSRQLYREALTLIEARTELLKRLPRPAGCPAPSTDTLPRVLEDSAEAQEPR